MGSGKYGKLTLLASKSSIFSRELSGIRQNSYYGAASAMPEVGESFCFYTNGDGRMVTTPVVAIRQFNTCLIFDTKNSTYMLEYDN